MPIFLEVTLLISLQTIRIIWVVITIIGLLFVWGFCFCWGFSCILHALFFWLFIVEPLFKIITFLFPAVPSLIIILLTAAISTISIICFTFHLLLTSKAVFFSILLFPFTFIKAESLFSSASLLLNLSLLLRHWVFSRVPPPQQPLLLSCSHSQLQSVKIHDVLQDFHFSDLDFGFGLAKL